jgi:type VI secretion system secreted protein VgrG
MAVHLKAGMTMVLEAGVQLSLKVGGNFIDINPGGIFIQGTMVMINSGGAAGSGAGASPTAPASPAAPDVPEEAKEAATARPGELPSTQAQPDQRQAQSPGSVRVGSQSQALREGAQEASPVCEECERAGQGQEPPDTTSGRPLSEVSEPQAETQAEPTGTSGGPTQGAPGGGGGGPPEEEEVQM